jgi:hypothetical protein
MLVERQAVAIGALPLFREARPLPFIGNAERLK